MPEQLNPWQILRGNNVVAQNPKRLKHSGIFPQKPTKTLQNTQKQKNKLFV